MESKHSKHAIDPETGNIDQMGLFPRENKTADRTSPGAKHKVGYDILGIKAKMKPLKLQLNKDAYLFIERLNRHIRENTGLNEAELKNEDNYYLISLAVLGFLSDKENLVQLFTLMLEGDTDWARLIDNNEDRFDEIKSKGVMVLNDFFIRTMKLTGMSKN